MIMQINVNNKNGKSEGTQRKMLHKTEWKLAKKGETIIENLFCLACHFTLLGIIERKFLFLSFKYLFSRMILVNFHVEINQNLYKDQDQSIRATLYDTIIDLPM